MWKMQACGRPADRPEIIWEQRVVYTQSVGEGRDDYHQVDLGENAPH